MDMLTRRITFRLYPTDSQAATLFQWRKLHQLLYNAALSNRKTQYQKFGHSVDYFEQQNSLLGFKEVWPEYKVLGSHALQATLKRVDFAFQRFFKGLGGYPKFKSIRHFSGWTYPCIAGWKAESDGGHGYLSLSKLGRVQMRGQARTWGTPTTCTVVYRHQKWYASITVQCKPERATGSGAVGIDLGCKDMITLSTGKKIAKPAFIKAGQAKVKAVSKNLRRKQAPNRKKKIKASRRWKKVRQVVSKLQRKVSRQREDWLHKQTSNIVSGNSLVGGEQLNVKGMTSRAKKGKRKAQKAGLNRSILEVGFGMIGQMLSYKLAEAGGFYIEAPTKKLKPTQRCVKCWELTPKTLAERMHICSNPKCGHIEDRDINAAQVNLVWAQGAGTVLLDAESPSSTKCGSMRHLGAKKRQKRPTLPDGETPHSACGGE
jgi:putative transposase